MVKSTALKVSLGEEKFRNGYDQIKELSEVIEKDGLLKYDTDPFVRSITDFLKVQEGVTALYQKKLAESSKLFVSQ